MIPEMELDLTEDFEVEEESSKTYKIRIDNSKVLGYIDNLEAMKQVVYKILNTERYDNIIYSFDYGVELNDLIGMPISYCIPEIERRITESLLQDDRIISVSDFEFETAKKGIIKTTFTVETTQGEFESALEVNI